MADIKQDVASIKKDVTDIKYMHGLGLSSKHQSEGLQCVDIIAPQPFSRLILDLWLSFIWNNTNGPCHMRQGGCGYMPA